MVDEQEKLVKEDYYAGDTGKKVLDFCIGFFAPGVILQFLAMPVALLFSTLAGLSYGFMGFSYLALGIIFLFLGVLFFVKFRKTRRYISIGLLCSVIVPLILFGACMVIISGMNF